MEREPVRFEMRLSAELSAAIDDWRRQQPDLPNRTTAIRRLLEVALKAEPQKPAGKAKK